MMQSEPKEKPEEAERPANSWLGVLGAVACICHLFILSYPHIWEFSLFAITSSVPSCFMVIISNTNANTYQGTHSAVAAANEWWKVDFGSTFETDEVIIYNAQMEVRKTA